jgi:4-hydroxyphenylpyruvate dioxygenase-like putative hemolysin
VQEELSFISTTTYLLSSNTRTFGRTHENDERRSKRNRKQPLWSMQMKKDIYCKYFKPVQDRQPCFLKFQRMGAKGFGAGTSKHFESIEREQELRGTLKVFALCEKNNHSTEFY